MKVLMTTDAVGGVFTYCSQLAAALRGHGVSVALASMGRRLWSTQRAELEAAGAQLFESEYRLEWMDDPWEDVERAGRWLLDVERAFGPDVVQVNGYAHAALPWHAPALVVAHSCVCSWWRAVLGEPAPERYARYRAEVARGLAAAACTVAPTEAMRRSLTDEYGPVRRSLVIHNGIVQSEAVSCRKQRFVLAAGRVWDRAKNIERLEQAAGELEVPVYVAGDLASPDAGAAASFSKLRLLGPLPRAELARWMRDAAVFAAPARYEPFGLSILEAAAAGCPLVLGDIPSLRELWSSAAVFVDPADARALARALNDLLSDEARCRALGARAAARARTYGVEIMARRYAGLYRSLTRRRSARELASTEGLH